MAKKKANLTFVENFGLAGLAAVISKTIAAPIERIKMVVQNQSEMVKQGILEKPFANPFTCGAWIMKNEGPLAFWKSNFTNCVRYFPTQALNFSFKGTIKTIPMFSKNKTDGSLVKLTKNVAAGGIAGGGSLICVYSLDYARTRLANDMKRVDKNGKELPRQFNGLIDCYTKTFKADGLAGLYRGFNISFVGIFVYRGLYFGLYDTIMPFLPSDVSYFVRFAVGYTVTVLAGLASYPIDTIRRRMMMTSGSGTQYNGSLDCAKQILTNEGWQSYFKGAGANIMRGIAGAMVISGFDIVKRTYIQKVYGPEYDI